MTTSSSTRRLLEMALGFVCACLAVSLALNIIIGIGARDDGATMWAAVWDAFLFTPRMAIFVAMAAAFTAAPIMIMAEKRGRRSFGYAILGGAASGVPILILWLAIVYYDDNTTMDEMLTVEAAMFPLTLLSLGILGGIVYWAVAGRRANNFQLTTSPE